MDAQLARTALALLALASLGASYRTQNFVVTAPGEGFARQVADEAERLRRDLAIEWLGRELPRWAQPCPIEVTVGQQLGAGGATSFMFDRGEVFGWQMSIQGSAERILDSVLPHEVTHTVFATHFRQPLPRWADEGACTTVEHESERRKQEQLLIQFLQTGRGIAFNRMFAMREYPPDILPLYSQGYSLARFLIAQGGQRQFIRYVGDGLAQGDWAAVTRQHYGYSDLADLQMQWLDWVRQGSPRIEPATPATGGEVVLASATLGARPGEVTHALSSEAAPADRAVDELHAAAATSGSSTGGSPTSGSPTGGLSTDGATEAAGASLWRAKGRLPSPVATASAAPIAPRPHDRGPAGGPASDRGSSWPATSGAVPSRASVTRPQPPQRVRETILEWSRPLHSTIPPSYGRAGLTPIGR